MTLVIPNGQSGLFLKLNGCTCFARMSSLVFLRVSRFFAVSLHAFRICMGDIAATLRVQDTVTVTFSFKPCGPFSQVHVEYQIESTRQGRHAAVLLL